MVLDEHARHSRPDRGLGLWNRSQEALRRLGAWQALRMLTHRIPPAAYRDRQGHWLSRCSEGATNSLRVATVLESKLLDALADGMDEGTLRFGAKVTAVREAADRVVVALDDGNEVHGSLVVGADGPHSLVRRCIFGESTRAVDTGLVSFSGILPHRAITKVDEFHGTRAKLRPESLAFETLSGGQRFALVPLRESAFWFATMSADSPAALQALDKDVADATVERQGVGPQTLARLRQAYAGWHDPIPAVLHAAACAEAEAQMGSHNERDGGPHRHQDLDIAQGMVRCQRIVTVPPLSRWHTRRCVLVGDAAHGMPINLAQGAAAAIEGSFLLGRQLAMNLLDCPDEASQAGAICQALASYERAHKPRIDQCRTITSFTALLARPANPVSESVRNSMRFVPRAINERIFDAFLEWSLGERPRSTARLYTAAFGDDEVESFGYR